MSHSKFSMSITLEFLLNLNGFNVKGLIVRVYLTTVFSL